MALRVLLVDESATIKRVFKLALQDYGVEIFTLSIDGDIPPAIKQLKPDILFLDILLKKKSGYEISHELKTQSEFSKLPVILLWSHFVKLNEAKFKSSKADYHLEKPFNINSLRKIVHTFVPKTKKQSLSLYLEFPKIDASDFSAPSSNISSIDISSSKSPSPSSSPPPSLKPEVTSPQSSSSVSSLLEENEENEEELALRNTEGISLEEGASELEDESSLSLEEEEDWVQKNVFKIEDASALLEGEKESEDDLFSNDTNDTKDDLASLQKSENQKVHPLSEKEEVKSGEKNSSQDFKLSEEAVYSQSKKIIESIAWQVVPELAAQIIEKEIKRLLAEQDQEA